MARYPSDRKQQTRETVLRHAANQLRAHGPEGVSVAAVMKDAGLTHGGFYAHFSSKDAMVAAAIEYMFGNVRDRWAHETLDLDPATGLARYVDWYLSAAHRDAPATGCPVAALAADMPRMSAKCRAAFAAGAQKMTAMFAQALERLGHRDPAAAASSLAAELVGAVSIARLATEPQRADAILAASRRSIKQRLGLDAG
ncbi:MAG: TetR/AcrR family transcriptional regulator [Deltaproteobacteria bacterium]|nr:TetR/AcrR family transcriptional regulator [Deltaproteobacteria bacterium]